MRKIILLMSLVLTTIVSFGQKPQTSIYTESSARNIEPRNGVIVTPMLADLQVISQQRIEYSEVLPYTVTSDIVPFVASLKKTVFFNATKINKCDALVASLIDVTTTNDGLLCITVTGYPARYTNFRNATADDVWMVQMHQLIDKTYDNDVFVPATVDKVERSIKEKVK